MTIPPISDELRIALRCYAGPQFSELRAPVREGRRKQPLGASGWAIIFDTETTTGPDQALRFGTYQVRYRDALRESGIFYDPEGVSAAELATLQAYAAENDRTLLSRDAFVDDVFFRIGWQLRATIIGFNLPFDISRLAIAHGPARREMRGGFSFTLSRQKIYPHVQVKHLSRRAAFIRFAGVMGQLDARSARKRGTLKPHRAGHFVDVKTIASALLSRGFSLDTLGQFLGVENPKLAHDDFDGPIDDAMIRYAARDVQTTWECYVALRDRLASLNLSDLAPEKVYSEASIGKAYLRGIGIVPWQKSQPDFPTQRTAYIMSAYFGGRSEVRIRREICEVMLCDFLAMYPTVCTLMGLWRFAIAEGVTWTSSTAETRTFLANIDLDALQKKAVWPELATLVRVKPVGDIFPVRASYGGGAQHTIGANHLTSEPLWFTLADCITAKLLTGQTPEVVEAVTFAPGPVQTGLRAIDVNGNPAFRVDPQTDDFFKRVTELRQRTKQARDAAEGDARAVLNIEQNALKICANSTSYGVWMEVNVVRQPEKRAVTVKSAIGDPFSFRADKIEEPGPYFHPLIATLITSAARLMLAIGERLIGDHGLGWAFCDTDSLAIAKPSDLSRDTFHERVIKIVDWFAALNPYDFAGSILEIEEVNQSLETGEPEPLHCLAISSKRYALFNLGRDDRPILRKVSAHGLGHLLSPYQAGETNAGIPAPHPSVLGEGIAHWHCDLWYRIVSAALNGTLDRLSFANDTVMRRAALSRYAATSPDLLRWFNPYNSTRAYRDQVKPFNFMLAMSEAAQLNCEPVIGKRKRGRPRKVAKRRPVAPFDQDVAKAADHAFDRDTGLPVPVGHLKTYAETLAQYHLSPESKFLNGNFVDRGETLRRHVRATGVRLIGKESYDWERQALLGLNLDSEIAYDQPVDDLSTKLQSLIDQFGERTAAKALGIPVARVRKLAIASKGDSNTLATQVVAVRLPAALNLRVKLNRDRKTELEGLRVAVKRDGLRHTARRLGIDPSNLRRRLHS
ncbi:hypothetical protein OK349_15455 [Sphingomonas sp. BT-65]|uniref:hypothetical protein n=1 Tax=Sphingomonas sp. BT-65 TaxID=2989821 RepID=UPI002235E1EA|nr:hypothetical protein [Sphingomonas sp. BT-65]MCW4463110.1 hypothetical protein [Sphingomonas sp. BT-65]